MVGWVEHGPTMDAAGGAAQEGHPGGTPHRGTISPVVILLIHPPVAKPSEPPAGISRLSGLLGRHGVEHALLDANLEGLLHLLGLPLPPGSPDDPWTRRSFRNCTGNLAALRDPRLYRQLDRYKRTVRDLGKVLATQAPPGVFHGLADYLHPGLSPVRSADLLAAAQRPESDPYHPYYSSRLRGIFDRRAPSLVGLSLNYLSQALCTFSMIGFIRREFPGTKLVLGGGLVTSWLASRPGENPFAGLVDHVVAGPGEPHLMALLGLGAGGDGLPRPEYRDLPRRHYLSPGFILPYSASTGCPWKRCTFCPEAAERNPYRPIPTSQAVADLKALQRVTAPSLIHLLDNALSPALLEGLCADPVGAPWYGFSRVGRHLADPDFCRALRQSGCVMLKLGIESGDQGVLDALGKGISVATAAEALRNLKQAGIATYVHLLFGTPVETEAGARRTLEFTAGASGSIDFLNLSLFAMPAGGANEAALETRGFSDGDLSLYTDFTHPLGWDRKKARRFIEKVFNKHPAVAAIRKREVPIFTSNHAPFFAMGGPAGG